MTRAALFLASLLPVMAQAQSSLDGTYAVDCADPPFESRLTITGETIAFYESTCTLTNPIAVRGIEGAALYDLVCTGEGESWSDRTLLMPGHDGGLVRVVEGFAWTYARCQ